MRRPVTVQNIWAKVNKTPTCWLWTGSPAKRAWHGYGAIGVNGQTQGVHRWFYTRYASPIPDGLELDHLCPNRACVRPSHLEPVTHAENCRRAAERRRGL